MESKVRRDYRVLRTFQLRITDDGLDAIYNENIQRIESHRPLGDVRDLAVQLLDAARWLGRWIFYFIVSLPA